MKMSMIDAIRYVKKNKLHAEANKLANKVGDSYMVCLMLYINIPQTKENLEKCKKLVEWKKESTKQAFDNYINGGYENGINS